MNLFAKVEINSEPQQFNLRSWVTLEPGQDEDEWVMIDSHSGSICACNGSAGTLLCELQHGASCDQLASALTHQFDVSTSDARRDALLFLQKLSSMGVVYEDE